MDFTFSAQEEQFRAEIRQFARENLPENHIAHLFEEEHSDTEWDFSMRMSKKLAEKGWLTLSWPKQYGGMEASVLEQVIFREETSYYGVPGISMGVSGTAWVGPSIMLFGTEEQKKKYLPPIAAGEPDGIWCTGYSEPDSGSDLASLQTSAVRKGDTYIINGQKVWTSAAHRARWLWLAARTNADVKSKHHGISLFIVDMKSKGLTVRPLKNYVGYKYFNEVFFKDVEIPAANLVGEENKGWQELMTALSFERTVSAGFVGTLQRLFDEMLIYLRETGRIKKSKLRTRLAECALEIETLRMMVYETAWKASNHHKITYEPSRDKAFNDKAIEIITKFGTEILDGFSMIDPLYKKTQWTRIKGAVEHLYWMSPAACLAAGTTDTQKNIIGQFALQLPRSY